MGGIKRPNDKRPARPGAKKQSGDPRADRYFYLAKSEGFAARSVYKLEEIDKKYRLIRPGMNILDLGCAPGSWTQYASKAVGPNGHVLGIDRTPIKLSLPNVTTLAGDIFEIIDKPRELFPQGFQAVLSDMAPNTTGIKDVDAARSLDLAEAAARVALKNLVAGGTLLIKIFFGPDTMSWIEGLKMFFDPPQIIRPEATRKESREVYVLCRRFRGLAQNGDSPENPREE